MQNNRIESNRAVFSKILAICLVATSIVNIVALDNSVDRLFGMIDSPSQILIQFLLVVGNLLCVLGFLFVGITFIKKKPKIQLSTSTHLISIAYLLIAIVEVFFFWWFRIAFVLFALSMATLWFIHINSTQKKIFDTNRNTIIVITIVLMIANVLVVNYHAPERGYSIMDSSCISVIMEYICLILFEIYMKKQQSNLNNEICNNSRTKKSPAVLYTKRE